MPVAAGTPHRSSGPQAVTFDAGRAQTHRRFCRNRVLSLVPMSSAFPSGVDAQRIDPAGVVGAGPDSGRGQQQSLWSDEPALSGVTFVVVDLETSGTSPGQAAITEIGAVKVRGGEVLGEFASFVHIDTPLPADITRLTGITDADLRDAPPISEVFPAFCEFARGATLVAHNARFDMGFLKAAASRLGYAWDFPPHLCTLVLSRRIVPKSDTRSYRLSDLAYLFNAKTEPNHRALYDARATVDVLHGLIERVGDCGVQTLRELREYDNRLSPSTRRKATLADDMPQSPGVYIFRDDTGVPLYVGSSINIRNRARSYFSGGDSRTRMRTMVGLAASIEAVECANDLEAWVREEQLIDALQPPFNRRSKAPRRGWWVAPGTRDGSLKVDRIPFDGSVGPFRTKNEARAAAGIYGDNDWEGLCAGTHTGDLGVALEAVASLAAEGKFERAARRRDELAPAISALAGIHSLGPLARCTELVLAQRLERSWTFAVIRYGRLAAAGTLPRGADWSTFVASLQDSATHIDPGDGPLAGATLPGLRLIARWMDLRPTRIVSVIGSWSEPAAGAQQLQQWADTAKDAAREARRVL